MNHEDVQATYREEFIALFERGQSPLRRSVTAAAGGIGIRCTRRACVFLGADLWVCGR